MQMTVFPPPQNHFEQRSHASPPGKFHSPFTTSSASNMSTNKNIRMAQPPSTKNKNNNNTRSSFSAGSSSNAPFGKSKFFLKKEIKCATKIQAMIRAFLVQARLYRERVLAPRQRELEEVQSRKQEELKRIQDQFEQEYAELPAKMEQDFEDALLTKDGLEEKIKLLKTVNEELSEERKEAKKINRKLEAESQSLKEQCFKLDVHIHKTQKENQELRSAFDEYEWAVNSGNQQRDELEAALMKCVKQQEILKKYINRAIKKVETRALSMPRRNSSKKQLKRSSSSGCAQALRRASTGVTTSVRRSKSSKSPIPLNPPSPTDNKKKRRPSLNKNIDGHASFDWSRMSDRNLNVLLDASDDSQKQKQEKQKRRSSLNKNLDGIASFDWARMSDRNLNAGGGGGDMDESISHNDLLEKQPEDQACFDWANNSYTWASQAAGHQSMSALHDIVAAGTMGGEGTKVSRKSLPRLNRRRSSELLPPHQGKSSSSSSASASSGTADVHGMRELLQELKTIKKEGAVWVDWRGKTRQIKPSWA